MTEYEKAIYKKCRNEYTKEYKKKNKEKAKRYQYKSMAKGFINNFATLEDIRQLEILIENKKKEELVDVQSGKL